jgi:Rieske Fe-S protein
MVQEKHPHQCDCVDHDRRRSVGLILATGLAAVLPDEGAEAADAAAAKAPPQAGDELVFAKGPNKGKAVTLADLAENGTLIEAWAKDPASGTIRNKSRLNRVIVVRVDQASLDETTAQRAADGVVAYSGFCTHAGCFIEKFLPDQNAIFCHCHDSKFDPVANGKVIGGPAKAPLAGLPVKVEGEMLLVAGEFQGKVGAPKA